jgi:predicted aldo/keto reductase-like oxidoreductase
MEKVRLGKTNLKVSRVGIGGIPLQRPSEKEAVEVIQHALDKGINLIDTSIGYGQSEIRIGKAIAGRRDDVIIITRTGSTDGERMKVSLEKSMKQLQTDYIDVYEMHNVSTAKRYDEVFAEGGSLEAMYEAKEQGKIGFLGFTSHCMETMLKAVKSEAFDVILFPFNFVNNDAAEKLVPLTKKLDIGFTAMKPFAGGRLRDVDLVMKYLLQFDNVIPVPGVEKKIEIDQIIDVVEGSRKLTENDELKINEIRNELGTKFCQWCGYCQPGCPEEIDIPMMINAELMYSLWPENRLKEWYSVIIANAHNCTECGNCEEACPYNLPIRDLLKVGREFIDLKLS